MAGTNTWSALVRLLHDRVLEVALQHRKRLLLIRRDECCSGDFRSTGEPGLSPSKVPVLSIAWQPAPGLWGGHVGWEGAGAGWDIGAGT